jgi:hypothetical protein
MDDDAEGSAVVAQLRPVLQQEALALPVRETLRERLIAGRAALNQERLAARADAAGGVAARADAAGGVAGPSVPGDVAGPVATGDDAGPVATGDDAGPAATGDDGPPVQLLPRPRRPGRIPGWAITWGVAATVLVAASTVVVVAVNRNPGQEQAAIQAVANLADPVSADPAAALTVHFTRPLDHASVLAALRISPAVQVRSTWQGDSLQIAPVHGFAPNTAYLVSVDRSVARTSSGAGLAADVAVAFGTAQAATVGESAAPVTGLGRLLVADAAAGSEAVIVRDGSILMTAARSPNPSGAATTALVRVRNGISTRMGAAVDAICVSRSGNSVAYLKGSGASAQLVFADATGDPQGQLRVNADPNTSLGWIGDSEVSYVSAGRLQAVDRAGHVRQLSATAVDPARDVLALAPGGRYAYLAAASGPGEVLDLRTRQGHPLPGATGSPAFSADGASVTWVQGSGRSARLATAPSAGGPILSVPLGTADGDTISDLALSPTAALLAYTVTAPHGSAQLRVASLPDGNTVGVSELGPGESPNWDPSGDGFTVLGRGPSGPQIQAIRLPAGLLAHQNASLAVTRAFADAQISADSGAQQALAGADVTLPELPPVSRAAVVWLQTGPGATATARVRLTTDAAPNRPVIKQVEETIRLDTSGAVPRIVGVEPGSFGGAPAGPQLLQLDTDSEPGTALLTFDSDLAPATVEGSITLSSADGRTVPAVTRYDPQTRTASVRPVSGQQPGAAGALTLRVAPTLQDIAGRRLQAAVSVTIYPAADH